MSQFEYSAGDGPTPHERGSRRRKLAAMAGNMYRAGVAAASELKEQYNTRGRGVDTPDYQMDIPGSFPNVAIVTRGDEQMVLFPSYAKRHIRMFNKHRGAPGHPMTAAQMGVSEEEYWNQEWARVEDEKAVVDVDVRGWIYTPHRGPMTRRNRILIGLARRLSGIPSPSVSQADPTLSTSYEDTESLKEEQRIAKEAHEIEKKGQVEKEVANRGGFSEPPKEDDSELDSSGASLRSKSSHSRSGSRTPSSAPSSPTLTAKSSWAQPAELTEAELAVANANLMARIGPFMTNPLVSLPITLFFYNETQSQSRTVMTNDAGHFSIRAPLDFVPSHVRVLANENISATEPIQIIERTGISLISDIDDTIKKSNISLGAREIFRNTFIRDLGDLTVKGVKEWYESLHEMGVRMHYCSNSPWQLFPMIATFFHIAGLPPGSIHLKQYSGMLQGIFEPVAERKKGTLDKIMRDFPERRFLLVGDSGEADLEVYTELAIANPGRIMAIFIRDVTTPEQMGYFDPTFAPGHGRRSRRSSGRIEFEEKTDMATASVRPILPARIATAPDLPPRAPGPVMGTLIDLSDEPEEMSLGETLQLHALKGNPKSKAAPSNSDLISGKLPPPRPNKPLALRSTPSEIVLNKKAAAGAAASTTMQNTPPTSNGRGLGLRPAGVNNTGANTHPLAQMQNSSDQSLTTSLKQRAVDSSAKSMPPPPPPPRRRGTPSFLSLSPRLLAHRRTISNNDVTEFEALPGSAYNGNISGKTSPSPTSTSGSTTPTDVVSKKVDLWRRRLAKAQDVLDQHGVALYTWRCGQDVVAEAEGIVKGALEAMEKRQGR